MIDELSELRADVPPMTDAAFARGLNRIEAALADPNLADPSLTELSLGRPTSHRPGQRRLAYLATAAAVAAVTVAAGTVVFGHHSAHDSAAADVLTAAANQAQHRPTLHPRPGQYVYVHIAEENHGQPAWIDYWIPADRSGRERICVPNEACTDLAYNPSAVRDPALPYDVLSGLPTTADGMLAWLRSNPSTTWQISAGWTSDLATWATASDLLPLLPPAQQTAVFKALATLPGVRRDGVVTTFDGHQGTALSSSSPDEGTFQLVFELNTHAYLGSRNIQPHAKAPEFNSTGGVSTIVNAAGQR